MIDYKKVAAARKRNKPFYSQNVRYHVHGSKESEFKPGLPSDDLREAMGLMSNQIPSYIYHMRVLGYPPGWMAEAAVESSGITVYGSDGNVEAGGTSEDGPPDIKIQYDPDKLVDYPGFNAVLPTDFVDEADKLGFPPIHFQDLRCVQETFMVKPDVRPKRKRELVENRPFKVQRCEVDMEMEENSDEDAISQDYEKSLSGFVPPLPIETVPPPPPDDPPLPPEDEAPPPPVPPPEEEEPEPPPPGMESPVQIENDTPSFVPPLGFNLNSNDGISNEAISGTSSPSLTELEEMRKRLVMELTEQILDEDTMTDDALRDNALETGLNVAREKNSAASSPSSLNEEFVALESSNDMSIVSEISVHSKSPSRPESPVQTSNKLVRSESRTSQSKFMTLGTPSLSRHSSYTKLPDYELFSKDVTSHINFENLPNSTGTFQRIKGVLKKVKEKMKFL
ncbi:zinc finger CCHC domain-containing protein 8 homolog [Uloborus diversus]|uniref:zinc finger CCHC domain-containing protein 8 homolog n=1 Tax=Uloborus diversus TaxID=327109 RepID=UPI0024098C7A|nr:zinc finger CCHC domain-containing protein 8 homolog [Uloborus diversus]